MRTLIDNTLREGEQTPGVAFTVDDKVEIVSSLVEAGVTHFDAAFPESSERETVFLRRIHDEVLQARVGASCRLRRRSIETLIDIGAREIFVVMPVSDIHIEGRLRTSRTAHLEHARRSLDGLAEELVVNVALEDYFRSDMDYTRDVALALSELGAARLFLADTVGTVAPWEVSQRVSRLRSLLPETVALGTHFHNDLGMALANTLAALRSGATHPTAAINGLGERAGNTDLLQLAAGIRYLLEEDLPIHLERLYGLSRLLMARTGILVAQNNPVTGHNAFTHTSGIHVHGVLADRRSYEALPPEDFGQEGRLVLGKHSGRAHLRHLLGELPDEKLEELLLRTEDLSLERARRARRSGLLEDFEAFNDECLGVRPEDLREDEE